MNDNRQDGGNAQQQSTKLNNTNGIQRISLPKQTGQLSFPHYLSVDVNRLVQNKKEDWYRSFTRDDRNVLVDKLARVIVPKPNAATMNDERMYAFVALLNEFEAGVFEKAKSTLEYIQSMVMKTTDIYNEFEKEKKQKEQLQQALLPTWEKMNSYGKYDYNPFRLPVDPVSLGIPNYFEIVRKPMDLSTIRNKLTTGQYSNPREYIDDVWLMFDNAWLFNNKISAVHKFCTQLSNIFKESIDRPMQSLGYCCGQNYKYCPKVLRCYGNGTVCWIPRYAKYHSYLNASNDVTIEYSFCQKCFKSFSGDTVPITISADPTELCQINKSKFIEMRNKPTVKEPIVNCISCGRGQHQICVLHHEKIWPGGFECDNCSQQKGEPRKENKFNAANLQQRNLSAHIESRVNSFLMKQQVNAGKVHIRVVSSSDKIVKPELRSNIDGYPYRAKTIFAFQEIDGIDVCFFGMYVQEYGSECPSPNTRRVYIAYLDSVHFFKPKEYRTDVYHEILLGYFNYVKELGYTMAHIWANPPGKGDDYIFDHHPPEQKIPTPKRLQDWYKKMLKKGVNDGIVLGYKNIVEQTKEDGVTTATDLPYFDGDHLPVILEKFQEENKKKSLRHQSSTRWFDEFCKAMEKHKNAFFVVRLHPSAADLPPIQDPDEHFECDIMAGRDPFLDFTREHQYEFSSLRHVQNSTLGILYALHNKDVFMYHCDRCENPVESRYHCTVCEDYDLCAICKDEVGQDHPMEKVGLDLDVNSVDETEPTHKQLVQRWAQSLLHAYVCDNEQCRDPRCAQLKILMRHMENCKERTNKTCMECKKLIALWCYHAKNCTEAKCPVQPCAEIKHEFQQKQAVYRERQEENLRRRVSLMSNDDDEESSE